MKSAYQIKWTCLQFSSKNKIAKFVTKNTIAMVIGNVILTYSKGDIETIEKNISGKSYPKPHKFEITDKQFGLIRFTTKRFYELKSIKKLSTLKNTKMPNLLLNNNGWIALIPVTNKQFMGDANFGRKTFWL
jgi:hypothetical protein